VPDPEYRYTAAEPVAADAVDAERAVAYGNLSERGQRFVDRALATDGRYWVDRDETTLPAEFYYEDGVRATTLVVRDGSYYRVTTGGDGQGIDVPPVALPVLWLFGILVLAAGVDGLATGALLPAQVGAGVGIGLLPVAAFSPSAVAGAFALVALTVGGLGYVVHLVDRGVR